MTHTDEEVLTHLKDSICALLERDLALYDRPEQYGTVPRPLFKALADLGVTGLSIPEQLGGSAVDVFTSMTATEQIAYSNLGPAIFTCVHNMVAGLITKHGTASQHECWLPKMASGEFLGAFALTEPKAGSDAASLTTKAVRSGDDYILNGEKCYITSAGSADLYLVFARTGTAPGGKGISCFIVPSNAQGLSISSPDKKMGCELSPIASLQLEQVRVPAANRLGAEDGGYAVALSGLAGGRVSIAACANGIARKALDIALSSVRERQQFGATIGSFQGIQFMLADLWMLLEASQLMTQSAARALDHHNTHPSTAHPTSSTREIILKASGAKCFATDAAMKITTDAVQLLGGAGYLKDFGVERLMRDAKMLQIVEGTNQIQRWVIGRELAKS